MTPGPVALSSARVDPACGIRRDCPRPPTLRNASFAGEYDWDTLFYDVYRAGRHVVLQGPPFFNFLGALRQAEPLRRAFGFPRFAARHIGAHKRGEIWWRSDAERVTLACPLGRFALPVQPDMSAVFAGRRVLTTISRNNEIRWLCDWAAFYRANHGADAVLLYDNGSDLYDAHEAQAQLREALPGMMILVVSWPFPFGPQGGLAGAVDGVETQWDSDFAQIGSLQHARHRFLRRAASVLNVDPDELVLPVAPPGIFAATEASRHGMIRFAGRWIGIEAAPGITRANCRHADFFRRLSGPGDECPPKWCIVPGRGDRIGDSWSIHNVFGARGNRRTSADFSFRHLRAITTSWKEERWAMADAPGGIDGELQAAYAAAGLRSGFAGVGDGAAPW